MHSLDDRLSFELKGIRKKKNYGILLVVLPISGTLAMIGELYKFMLE
jgi:hypothetical protein